MSSMRLCPACGKGFVGVKRGAREQKCCTLKCSKDWKLSPPGIAERFWSKVDKSGGDDACWPWLAGCDEDGYGKFSYGGRENQVDVRANRFALETAVGDIGEFYACHTCDHPGCCNPRHLFAGTVQDNNHDCKAKGRTLTGATWHAHDRDMVKLDGDEEALAICDEVAGGEKQAVIAARHGIHQSQVSRIANGKRWAHVVRTSPTPS